MKNQTTKAASVGGAIVGAIVGAISRALITGAIFIAGASQAHAEVKASIYGFLKADYYGTSNEFNTDAKPFNVLSTSGQPLREASRGQLSMKQSRFGINVDNESKLKGKFEFDLDGEANNTVGAVTSSTGFLRVRQANISYKVSDEGTLTIGKKWDIFSPLQPHSYQMTMIQWWSGNTGFLTDGIDYLHKMEHMSFAAELKNAGGNPANAADNTTVKLSLPIATVRGDYSFSDQLIGLSYMYGKLNYSRQDVTAPFDTQDANVNALNVYWNGKFGATDVVAEYYTGINVGAGVVGGLSQPSLAQATANRTDDESGFYVSGKHQFDGFSIFGGYGRADFSDKNAAPTNSINGLVSNETYRLGADCDLDAGTKAFVEVAHLKSSFLEVGDTRDYEGSWWNVGLLARF
ncbi:hypothetical protein BH10BDE1_BH10BDE1_12860 [soil metagenome]